MALAAMKLEKDLKENDDLAEKFLAEADAKNLYELYQKTTKNLRDLTGVLETMMEMYAGKGQVHRPASDESIEALRTVALAAIDLAKTYAPTESEPEKKR